MIQSYSTPEALADAVARHIVDCAADAIAARGRFVIALSGGSTPKAAYSRLATRDTRPRAAWPERSEGAGLWGHPAHEGQALATDDWRLIHILWADERCVPPDDPQSNYRMAKEALLDRVPIPPNHIHRIRGEDEPERAASEYERTLRSLLDCHPERSAKPAPSPVCSGQALSAAEGLGMTDSLDLVLLGLGEDGHTASLFPGQSAVRETARWVVAVPGSSRVTLTPVILNRARNVTFVVSGANKAQTLQRVVEGPFNPDILPAQAIRPGEGRLTWMVDEAAAGALRPHRAST